MISLTRYKCLVIDDEPPAREILKRYIAEMPMLALVAECANAVEAITFLREQPVDLLLLDIQMPQLSGIDLVKTLLHPPKIILTTAFAGYALKGYDIDAVDYLLKPIAFDRFARAINKAFPAGASPVSARGQQAPAAAEPFHYFRADRKMVKVILSDILYIESLKDYIRITTRAGSLVTKQSMISIEAILPPGRFLRTHRSFVISIAHVTSFSNSHVTIGSVDIPIGKLYARETQAVLTDS